MVKLPLIQSVIPVLLAVVAAVTWTYLTRDMYNYNMGFHSVLTLNVFPLIGWIIALISGYWLVNALLLRLPTQRVIVRFLAILAFYSIAVIIAETVGYHLFGVHNIGTSHYAGLPLCDCLHAPGWMQAGYFLLGPIHWVATRALQHYMSPLLKRAIFAVRQRNV